MFREVPFVQTTVRATGLKMYHILLHVLELSFKNTISTLLLVEKRRFNYQT